MTTASDPSQMELHPVPEAVPTAPAKLEGNRPANVEHNDRLADFILTVYHEDEPGFPGTPRKYS
jgi:hypothetical protein